MMAMRMLLQSMQARSEAIERRVGDGDGSSTSRRLLGHWGEGQLVAPTTRDDAEASSSQNTTTPRWAIITKFCPCPLPTLASDSR